jgi:hypothetical protein
MGYKEDYMKYDILNFRPLVPMGAVRDDDNLDKYIDDPDYEAEIKYDGYAMIGWFTPTTARFTTRSVEIESFRAGNPVMNERTDHMPHFKNLQHDLYGTIVDGQIWKEGCTSHDITSMIGGLPQTSWENQKREGKVHYIIYDVIQWLGKDVTNEPRWKRRNFARDVVEHLKAFNPEVAKYIHFVEIVPHEEKRQRYEEIVAAGGEGLVLKHIESKYYEGKINNGKGVPAKHKASKSKGIPYTPWVKWKKYDTFDCVVLGFNPAEMKYTGKEIETWPYWQNQITGEKFIRHDYAEHPIFDTDIPITKGHYYGWPGSIIFGQYSDGEMIEVGNTSGISEHWKEIFKSESDLYIGRVVEVGAMERIKKTGALREPRFIRFRDDKNDFECVIE